MTETTTIVQTAATAAKAKFVETLPPETLAALDAIQKTLATPGTQLGSLVRRVKMGARVIHEGIQEFGSRAIVAKVGNSEHVVPLETSVDFTIRVRVGNGEPQAFTFTVGATPTA